MKKSIFFACLLTGMMILLAGCSSGKTGSGTVSLNVGLVAPNVREDKVESLAADLKAGLPEYNDATKSIKVTGVSSGNTAADPMSVVAGSTKIATMMSSGEIELWITDPENAQRYAGDGTSYLPLNPLFTEEELASFNGTPVQIAVTDDTGKETGGATSGIYGIDLSQNAAVRELTGLSTPQMFIFANSTNIDAAKAAFRFIATKR